MKIAILIPFYNEKDNLSFLINEWESYLKKKFFLQKKLFFVFVDDGSTDQSSKIIKKNIKKLNYIIVKKKNSGHGNSCKFGINLIIKKYKKYKYIFQIDGDNQCDPKYFFQIYELITNYNYKFIFGYRNIREDGYLRFLISKIMSITFFLKKFIYVKDLNTPYRAMNVTELNSILRILSKNSNYEKIELFNCLLSYGIKKYSYINWINIKFRKRIYGSSKYNLLKMLKLFLNFIYKI